MIQKVGKHKNKILLSAVAVAVIAGILLGILMSFGWVDYVEGQWSLSGKRVSKTRIYSGSEANKNIYSLPSGDGCILTAFENSSGDIYVGKNAGHDTSGEEDQGYRGWTGNGRIIYNTAANESAMIEDFSLTSDGTSSVVLFSVSDSVTGLTELRAQAIQNVTGAVWWTAGGVQVHGSIRPEGQGYHREPIAKVVCSTNQIYQHYFYITWYDTSTPGYEAILLMRLNDDGEKWGHGDDISVPIMISAPGINVDKWPMIDVWDNNPTYNWITYVTVLWADGEDDFVDYWGQRVEIEDRNWGVGSFSAIKLWDTQKLILDSDHDWLYPIDFSHVNNIEVGAVSGDMYFVYRHGFGEYFPLHSCAKEIRVDHQGNPVWNKQISDISYHWSYSTFRDSQLYLDTSETSYIAWSTIEGQRYENDPEEGPATPAEFKVEATRIDAGTGEAHAGWAEYGRSATSSVHDVQKRVLGLVPDGNGGSIVSFYEQLQNGTAPDYISSGPKSIKAQRFQEPDGVPQWRWDGNEDGVTIILPHDDLALFEAGRGMDEVRGFYYSGVMKHMVNCGSNEAIIVFPGYWGTSNPATNMTPRVQKVSEEHPIKGPKVTSVNAGTNIGIRGQTSTTIIHGVATGDPDYTTFTDNSPGEIRADVRIERDDIGTGYEFWDSSPYTDKTATLLNADMAIPIWAPVGLYDLVVENADGKEWVIEDGYEVQHPEPIINSVDPSTVRKGQGWYYNVALNGQYFQQGATITMTKTGQTPRTITDIQISSGENGYGNTATFDVNIDNSTVGGEWTVTLTNPDTKDDTIPITVEDFPAPIIDSIVPDNGVNNQDYVLDQPLPPPPQFGYFTITGANFENLWTEAVWLEKAGQNNINATFLVKDSTHIGINLLLDNTADITQKVSGDWSLKIRNKDQDVGTLTDGFQIYNPVPIITSVTPDEALNNGTISTEIAGDDFRLGATVKLAKAGQTDINATNVQVVSAAKITCDFDLDNSSDLSQKIAGGDWELVVTNPGPYGGGSDSTGFTINNPVPEVTSIYVSTGYNNETVTITNLAGRYFRQGATAKLTMAGQDDIPITITNLADNKITGTIDLNGKAEGFWDVIVTNLPPGGGDSQDDVHFHLLGNPEPPADSSDDQIFWAETEPTITLIAPLDFDWYVRKGQDLQVPDLSGSENSYTLEDSYTMVQVKSNVEYDVGIQADMGGYKTSSHMFEYYNDDYVAGGHFLQNALEIWTGTNSPWPVTDQKNPIPGYTDKPPTDNQFDDTYVKYNQKTNYGDTRLVTSGHIYRMVLIYTATDST